MPSGTTSLPIPSPGIAAMRCFIRTPPCVSSWEIEALAYQERAPGHTRGDVLGYRIRRRCLLLPGRRSRLTCEKSRLQARGLALLAIHRDGAFRRIQLIRDPSFDELVSDPPV